jgi:molecular chaperone DnaK
LSKVIGIDLGTTNSCVAILEAGAPLVIPNAEGSRITPSIVGFHEGERLVGQIARRQAAANAASTIFAVKRLIGRRFDSPEVRRFAERAPFRVEADDNGDACVSVEDERYNPADISAIILERMKRTAEDFLGEEVHDAVITVPAYFDDGQRQATKVAGKIAGLNVLRIINEPTAAALAYGLERRQEGKIAVFDLGGGTFDISILEIGNGVFEVRSTNGDTFLGGEDFDHRIVESLAREFEVKHGIDLCRDRTALQRLKESAEKAKQELSSVEEVEVSLPFIAADAKGDPLHLNVRLTRAKLETLVADLIARLEPPCRTALADAGLAPEEIQEVLLVGGMTRMPRVQERVAEIFGRTPNRGVNPEEVVAVGAAIQGSVLLGDVNDVLLLDVTPLSLGIETVGGVFTRIIEKNTTVPTKRRQVFTTATDNQDYVLVRVFQGEREMAADNRLLGHFELTEIPRAPRGVPQIEVTFDIDANGLVHVSAKDKETGREQSIRITAATGLSEEEIEKRVDEARDNAEKDRKRRDLTDARNESEGYIYQTERALAEIGPKLAPQDRRLLESAISSAREALDETDPGAVRAAKDTLLKVSHKLLSKIIAEQAGGRRRPKS